MAKTLILAKNGLAKIGRQNRMAKNGLAKKGLAKVDHDRSGVQVFRCSSVQVFRVKWFWMKLEFDENGI